MSKASSCSIYSVHKKNSGSCKTALKPAYVISILLQRVNNVEEISQLPRIRILESSGVSEPSNACAQPLRRARDIALCLMS